MDKKGGDRENGKEMGFVKWFSELSNKDVAVAGGKGASLAEMYNFKFPIPPGFVITAQAYNYFIDSAGLDEKIENILKRLNTENTDSLNDASRFIKEMIKNAAMPVDLEKDILEAYDILDVDKQQFARAKPGALDILRNSHEPPFVAVRSSATMEDLESASFAGQQESFLGVKGNEMLIEKVKACFASLFTARAIYYRKKQGFAHDKALLAVVVQKMINSHKSGVMFSQNPLKNDETIVIEAVWGLGEGIVSGQIVPDQYKVNSEFEIIDVQVNVKNTAIIRTSSGNIASVNLTPERSSQQVLSGHEIKRLAQYARHLEEHYGKPQDIEFAIADNEIFIVQSRPITTKVRDDSREVQGNVLLSGLGASPGIGSGTVKIVHTIEELSKVQQGDVLVTMMTNPDMVVTMQRAAAIVTDEGGVTSHAAIVSREMGIPCVVGTREATKKLKEGQVVTVDGYTGRVIDGRAEEKHVEITQIVPTRTKIKVIVDLPDYAKRAALCGATSVGLVRLEGIIGISGKHPVWYIKENKTEDYVKVLAAGLKKIAMPFNEIWIRTSDIRSDEYQHLEGAPQKVEGNPMLGDHGIRFSLKNADLLEAELRAIKEVADEFHDKIFGVMTPQVISVEEVRGLKSAAQEVVMPSNVKIGIMVETPAAVQIINELCEEGLAFISFGTNDLTQFTLALDRNNPDVQNLYSEMHPAVLHSLSYVIRRCKKYGVETSICGQAASKLEMARFLVGEGIDSISVNADAAHEISVLIAELESGSENIGQGAGAPAGSAVKLESTKEGELGINEEEIILQALDTPLPANPEDDYHPSADVVNDVPSLNDAIPVTSEQFEKQEDEISSVF